jgi:hypothetical protein
VSPRQLRWPHPSFASGLLCSCRLRRGLLRGPLLHSPLHRDLLRDPLRHDHLHGPLVHGLLVSRGCRRGRLIAHRWPSAGKLLQPLLQRLVLIGRYLLVIKDDTRLLALAWSYGAGTASGAPSIACRGATAATCRIAAYQDASTARGRAATMTVTTSGATQTAGPRDDHAAELVTPLHWSDVDVIQRGHYRQQRCPHRLVHAEGLAGHCWHHKLSRGLVRS